MPNIMEDPPKAQMNVYLQGVHGLAGKTEVYANNYRTGIVLLGFQANKVELVN